MKNGAIQAVLTGRKSLVNIKLTQPPAYKSCAANEGEEEKEAEERNDHFIANASSPTLKLKRLTIRL